MSKVTRNEECWLTNALFLVLAVSILEKMLLVMSVYVQSYSPGFQYYIHIAKAEKEH